jgi:uncharacterized protein YndB with AHSA1/START domain
MATKNKSNKIEIVREYDAPVNAVWEAWTDPKKVAMWWGPRGFTLTHHSKDLKPGGHWHYTMHGPDGKDYENTTKYLEVEKPSRLVYDHGGHKDRPPLFRVTVNFTDVKGRTRMEMSMELATPEAAEQMKKFIKEAGGNGTWDRLAEHLEKESSGKETFVINRSFDAGLDTMYEMWTNPKHFSKWLAPTGFNMEFIRADIKPGGSTFYKMAGPGGANTMYGRAHYIEVSRTQLQYTQEFTDDKENISRHPMAPTWPASMKTTVQFTPEGPNRTRVKVTWEVDGKWTKEELETFIKGRAGMTGGWTGSFDKLEAYLEQN